MKRSGVVGYILFVVLFMAIAVAFILISTYLSGQGGARQTVADTSLLPTIIIDAGHGGEDGGTIGKNGMTEKELNLEIAFLLRDMLASRGYDVLLTRSEDILLYDRTVDFKGRKKALDLAARVKIAEERKNCIFISIHMNAFPDEKYSGLQVYYSTNDEHSALLADEVQTLVKNALQPNNNRKTKPAGENIFLLDRITSPAILIECGFMSNPEECKMLCDEEYRKKLAFIISGAIEKYMSNTLEKRNEMLYN